MPQNGARWRETGMWKFDSSMGLIGSIPCCRIMMMPCYLQSQCPKFSSFAKLYSVLLIYPICMHSAPWFSLVLGNGLALKITWPVHLRFRPPCMKVWDWYKMCECWHLCNQLVMVCSLRSQVSFQLLNHGWGPGTRLVVCITTTGLHYGTDQVR